jgi:hypothetical protein
MSYVKNSLDCYCVLSGEDLYSCIRVENCQSSMYLTDSQGCHHCFFLTWCVGCIDCISCDSLENAQYCIKNIQYTKEEYLRIKDTLSLSDMRELWKSLDIKPRDNTVIRSEKSDGIYIIDSHEVYMSSYVRRGDDCRYITIGEKIDTVFDTNFCNGSDHLYECIS